MAIPFLDEPENQQFVPNDNLIRHQMFLMDYLNLFMGVLIGPLHIIRRFQFCLRLRLINYPMFTFQQRKRLRKCHVISRRCLPNSIFIVKSFSTFAACNRTKDFYFDEISREALCNVE